MLFRNFFSNSGSFYLAATGTISSANFAVGGVLITIYTTRADLWGTYNKLLESLVLSVLFYGVQIWGIGFLDDIEKGHLAFFKSLLTLPNTSPNYAVRLGTEALMHSYKIFSTILNWIFKISKTNVSRLPRICFESLKELAIRNPTYRYNWFRQVGVAFNLGSGGEDWHALDLDTMWQTRDMLLKNYGCLLRSSDFELCAQSKSLLLLFVYFIFKFK